MKPPPIKVEIVHIDGPLKGTIQELYDSVITIGRHPDCQVVFPRELTTISRHHLELRREGNRFQAVDQSTNGTLLNGKPIEQSYLKNGDVLTLGENGPKISILTSIISAGEVPEIPPLPAAEKPAPTSRQQSKPGQEPTASRATKDTPPPPVRDHISPPHRPSTENSHPEPTRDRGVVATQQPFVIQFGVMIKSYDTLPITLGSGDDCDFVIA
ncbi:MAG: FHA domain-containing protein, partial [Desulfofustis sp.]|nr:FHA domain-containing protein [Desulfofustis sp.]